MVVNANKTGLVFGLMLGGWGMRSGRRWLRSAGRNRS